MTIRFLYHADVKKARGWQCCYIDAETQAEADERAREWDTDGVYDEEIEVLESGVLESEGETTINDPGTVGNAHPDTLLLQRYREVIEILGYSGVLKDVPALKAQIEGGHFESQYALYRDQMAGLRPEQAADA